MADVKNTYVFKLRSKVLGHWSSQKTINCNGQLSYTDELEWEVEEVRQGVVRIGKHLNPSFGKKGWKRVKGMRAKRLVKRELMTMKLKPRETVVPSALVFGNMEYKPEMVEALPIVRTGKE